MQPKGLQAKGRDMGAVQKEQGRLAPGFDDGIVLAVIGRQHAGLLQGQGGPAHGLGALFRRAKDRAQDHPVILDLENIGEGGQPAHEGGQHMTDDGVLHLEGAEGGGIVGVAGPDVVHEAHG